MTLLPPVTTTASAETASHKIRSLGEIDPWRPLADDADTQTLSMFGREDLIAPTSSDYAAMKCAPLPDVGDPMTVIAERARATRIVIVNESHERSEHRGFTARVAKALSPLGYDVLAMEALSNPPDNVTGRFLPPFRQRPEQPFLEDDDGYYLSEAGFGRLGRQAKALGYRLLPYEARHDPGEANAPWEQRIAKREEEQAQTLAAYLRENPQARVLVHVGYSHAGEVPHTNGQRWMAARLKAMTGIDPLTVSQTTCRGGGATTRLAVLPAKEPAGMFDLVVDHPTARFVRRRPAWRLAAGDRAVAIPRALRPMKGWRIVEARVEGEPRGAVPMDRVAIRPGEDVALLLPPGRYRLGVIDVAPAAKSPAQ